MAQVMSPDEYEAFAATTEKLSKAHRGSHIEELLSQFLTLLGFAVESERAAAVATAAVAAAGAAVESHRTGALPGEELSVWEKVGACFDEDAVPIVEASAAAAFADLVSRSTRGDSSVARVLGVDRSRISQRVGERSLYTFVGPGEERYFPEWQFSDHATVPGLKQVLSAIPAECHPLSVDHFFTHANVDLELEGVPVAPARWLATGGSPKAVSDLAADL